MCDEFFSSRVWSTRATLKALVHALHLRNDVRPWVSYRCSVLCLNQAAAPIFLVSKVYWTISIVVRAKPHLLPLDEQLTKRGRRGGGYIFSFYRKMLTFMHLCPPQRKIHASIITGSTPDVVPPVSIKCLKKPILGAATGPDMRVNGFQMEADQCAPSRMRTVLIKGPEQVRMLFPPTPHPPNFASEFLLCL